jgi:hypothetical protein
MGIRRKFRNRFECAVGGRSRIDKTSDGSLVEQRESVVEANPDYIKGESWDESTLFGAETSC